jgi:hypothetical protein
VADAAGGARHRRRGDVLLSACTAEPAPVEEPISAPIAEEEPDEAPEPSVGPQPRGDAADRAGRRPRLDRPALHRRRRGRAAGRCAVRSARAHRRRGRGRARRREPVGHRGRWRHLRAPSARGELPRWIARDGAGLQAHLRPDRRRLRGAAVLPRLPARRRGRHRRCAGGGRRPLWGDRGGRPDPTHRAVGTAAGLPDHPQRAEPGSDPAAADEDPEAYGREPIGNGAFAMAGPASSVPSSAWCGSRTTTTLPCSTRCCSRSTTRTTGETELWQDLSTGSSSSVNCPRAAARRPSSSSASPVTGTGDRVSSRASVHRSTCTASTPPARPSTTPGCGAPSPCPSTGNARHRRHGRHPGAGHLAGAPGIPGSQSGPVMPASAIPRLASCSRRWCGTWSTEAPLMARGRRRPDGSEERRREDGHRGQRTARVTTLPPAAEVIGPVTLTYNRGTVPRRDRGAGGRRHRRDAGARGDFQGQELAPFIQGVRRGDVSVFRLGWDVTDLPGLPVPDVPLLAGRTGQPDALRRRRGGCAARPGACQRGSARATGLLREAERRVLEALPAIPLLWYRHDVVVRPEVQDLVYSQLGRLRLAEAWLDPRSSRTAAGMILGREVRPRRRGAVVPGALAGDRGKRYAGPRRGPSRGVHARVAELADAHG